LDRLEERLLAKEIRRQNNLDDVVEIAASQLKSSEHITDEPVNEDWTTRFFDIIQDVSDAEMKDLWGRILAGEIQRPKSFSLKTLELLRNLTKEEAELFVKISPYILGKHGDLFVFEGNDGDLSKYGIPYSEIAKLIEIGLVQPGTFVQKQFVADHTADTQKIILYQKIIILITIPAHSPKISIPVSILTHTGEELFSLLQPAESMDYIKELALFIKAKNSNTKVQYAYINTIHEDGKVNYRLPLIDL